MTTMHGTYVKESLMIYRQVIFCQGDAAHEPLRILDEEGPDAAIDFLAQWEPGESSASSQHGDGDWTYRQGPWLLSWNLRLGYIGLEREE